MGNRRVESLTYQLETDDSVSFDADPVEHGIQFRRREISFSYEDAEVVREDAGGDNVTVVGRRVEVGVSTNISYNVEHPENIRGHLIKFASRPTHERSGPGTRGMRREESRYFPWAMRAWNFSKGAQEVAKRRRHGTVSNTRSSVTWDGSPPHWEDQRWPGSLQVLGGKLLRKRGNGSRRPSVRLSFRSGFQMRDTIRNSSRRAICHRSHSDSYLFSLDTGVRS